MNSRRVIGIALAVSVLLGQALVPLARAACAVSRSEAPSCPSCAARAVSEDAALATDRSCCAAPVSLSDREPATAASDRGVDHRLPAAAALASVARAPIVSGLLRAARDSRIELHGTSPPLLRTTILLI